MDNGLMAVQCKKCGGSHPTWECTASTAKIAAHAKAVAVPDMPKVATAVTSKKGRTAIVHGDRPLNDKDTKMLGVLIDAVADAPRKTAGSKPQELPRPNGGPAVGGEVSTGLAAQPILEQAEAAAAHLAPKRGRPRIHPDRKVYKRDKERERRAKLRAEQEES